MNEIADPNARSAEFEPNEDALLTSEICDEALESAASSSAERITFTFSYNLFYCRFC